MKIATVILHVVDGDPVLNRLQMVYALPSNIQFRFAAYRKLACGVVSGVYVIVKSGDYDVKQFVSYATRPLRV